MKTKPLVSVLMTAYNREEYIAEAIESVLQSTYTNWELIITDDCSSDSTLNIATTYANQDNRIKVYRNPQNLGDYPNRNKAASYASGEFLMNVDSDDKLLPNSMEHCVDLFEDYPSADFGVFSPHHNCSEVMKSEEAMHFHFFNKPLFLVGPGGSIIRNNYFKSIGGFPTKYGPANDGYYNLNAATYTNTIIIPFELIFYRRHTGQEINNKYGYLYNSYLFLRDALNELKMPLDAEQKLFLEKKNKRRFFVNLLKFYFTSRDWKKTDVALKKSNFKFSDALTAVFQ